MTEVKTRPFRPFECYDGQVSGFHIHIQNADRILEVGDRVSFAGHNGEFVQLYVLDRSQTMRWISVDETLCFVCEGG